MVIFSISTAVSDTPEASRIIISGDAQDKGGTLCSVFIGLELVMRRKGDIRDDGYSWPVKSRHIESRSIFGHHIFHV